ncbi:membrane metalloprotease [Vulgatibacter incomptus]|uniref:Membrane metalloprotease n=1 Tax=Vulgatibacter incomptus TaxID=1391653 RepID=A0A0K1PBP0_9BACT|nr:membrane metalloprotease [Vulgatibacter incomptus]
MPVLLSLTVHEWAHAASANALGDDTAARMGRLTLNPIAHIDPFGTVLLPMIQLLSTGTVMFAWAKPVPVNPLQFTRKVTMRTGDVLVSAAGPASNLAIALGAAIGLGLLVRFDWVNEPVVFLLQSLFGLNIALAVFNLLPVPPLDGSHVLRGLLPRRLSMAYERVFPYAPMLLMGVIFFGRGLIHWPMGILHGWLWRLTALVAG